MLEQFIITELAVNKDKGYVLYDQSDEAILPDVTGQAKPEKIVYFVGCLLWFIGE